MYAYVWARFPHREYVWYCVPMKKRERGALTPIDRLIASVGSVSSLAAHTIVFGSFFVSALLGLVSWESMFLTLTTIVSLEAIYLAIFIQMSVNRQAQSLIEVEEGVAEITEDIDEIQEDVAEMTEDLGGIQANVVEITEDIEEIQEGVEEMSEDLDEIQEDVEGMSEDIEEIQEDVEEISEEKEGSDTLVQTSVVTAKRSPSLADIKRDVERILEQLEHLSKKE